jgi:hypothetical protein
VTSGHGVAQRLGRGNGEEAARPRQLGQVRAVAQQVLDLGGDVEGDVGSLGVEPARHGEGVRGAVEEVQVAEGDAAGAGLKVRSGSGRCLNLPGGHRHEAVL